MPTTLIVEDGTMPDGANTYAPLQTIAAYLTPRGAEEWLALSEDEQDRIAVLTTDYLNGLPWKGFPAESGRVMAWPQTRQRFADGKPVQVNIVPVQVVNAQCELCAYAAAGQFNPKAPVDRSTGAVTSEKVDVIAVSYATPETNAYSGPTGFPSIDGLLKPFLKDGGGKFGVVSLGRA
jgi:hypothetical protein